MQRVKKTDKVWVDAEGVCTECECSSGPKDAFKWARAHALRTGHSPTVIVTWDIHKVTAD